MNTTPYRNASLALALGLLLGLLVCSAATAPALAVQTLDGVTLYDQRDYGEPSEFLSADDVNLDDNVVGRAASSLRLQGPTQVMLFSEPNFQGRIASVISDTPNLDAIEFDNAVASLKVLSYPTGPVSMTDEFDGTALDPAWNWNTWWATDASYSLTELSDQFRVTIPVGDHGYWEEIPYLQRYDMGRGDFTLETEMNLTVFSPTAPAQAGLAIGTSHSQRALFGLREDGRLWLERLGWAQQDTPYTDTHVLLRVEKHGQDFTFLYRSTSSDPWQTLATWRIFESVEFVGLFGRTGWGGELLEADFDQFHLESDDIEPAPPTQEPTTPDVHDDFDTSTLDNAWTWHALQAGASYSLTEISSRFRIVVPAGDTNYDNWWEEDNTAQLRRSDLQWDWVIQTQLTLAGENPFDTCCFHTGLVIGLGTYDQVVFGLGQGRQLGLRRTDQYDTDVFYPSPTVELRIEKTSDRYLFKYRAAGGMPKVV
jgi:hypothetical protein